MRDNATLNINVYNNNTNNNNKNKLVTCVKLNYQKKNEWDEDDKMIKKADSETKCCTQKHRFVIGYQGYATGRDVVTAAASTGLNRTTFTHN